MVRRRYGRWIHRQYLHWRPTPGLRPGGLKNSGGTVCYFISIVQALRACVPLFEDKAEEVHALLRPDVLDYYANRSNGLQQVLQSQKQEDSVETLDFLLDVFPK